MKKKSSKQIVDATSDTRELIQLKGEIKKLQRIIEEKQILIDFKDKMIDLAETEYGLDIKKKLSDRPSTGVGSTEKS